MVKNTAGGCKGKKIARKDTAAAESRHLRVQMDETEMYAQVTTKFGGNELEVMTIDGIKRRCSIRGKFRSGGNRKKNFVTVFCWVLVGLRPWATDTHCDLLCVYTDTEKHQLKETYHAKNWQVFDENERNCASSACGARSAGNSDITIEFSNQAAAATRAPVLSTAKEEEEEGEEEEDAKKRINVDDI